MPAYVGAIDQGTTSTRFIVFDRGGAIVSSGAARARADLSEAGPCRARSRRRSGATRKAVIARGARDGGACAVATSPRSASRTSARPRCCGTAAPASRCTTRSSGRTRGSTTLVAALRPRRRQGPPARQDRPAARELFLRPQAANGCSTTSPGRARRRRPATRSSARSIPGSSGTSPAGRGGGLHITDVTNASRTQLMDLATLAWDAEILALFGIPRACLPRDRSRRARSMARPRGRSPACPSPASSATSRRRSSARPASSPARPRTPTAPAASC